MIWTRSSLRRLAFCAGRRPLLPFTKMGRAAYSHCSTTEVRCPHWAMRTAARDSVEAPRCASGKPAAPTPRAAGLPFSFYGGHRVTRERHVYDGRMVERVLLASPRGYCAGVERAVETVELALGHFGAPIYVRKQ